MDSKKLLNNILTFLRFETVIVNGFDKNSNFDKTRLAESIFQNLADDKRKSLIDAIYFAGDYPFIYFRTISEEQELTIKEIAEIQRKIWNEGQAPLLFVISPKKIHIYDCFARPSDSENELPHELVSYNIENDKFPQELEDNFNQEEIDTGKFWKNSIGTQISTDNKVDKRLLANLHQTRRRLINYDLSDSLINDLLGRCLFVFYLEDRNVPLNDFLGDYSSLFDILKKQVPNSLYSFFIKLKEKFNGDLFPITDIEKEKINNATTINENGEQQNQILSLVYSCFYGNEINQNSIQQVFWKIFDYKVIHIETISSVYEEFIHKTENEETISQNGTFYTPKMLVDLVLNELLPQPTVNDADYDIKILDPACGSGIFLVQAYKRLIDRWIFSQELDNKNTRNNREILENILKKSIFGVELDEEAIKVAALSLYLALLDKLDPKEIWAIKELPNLIYDPENNKTKGRNLFKSNTFKESLYGENGLGSDFQIIVGNPPWKRGNLDNDIKNYLTKNKLPQEIVAGYLHLMPEKFPNAKIGLVTSAKVFFNSQNPYKRLQEYLFKQTNIETIFNLALISENKLLFSKASQPTFALVFSKNNTTINNTINYCIPKPSNSIKNLNYIQVDSSDIKFIPKILVDLENEYNILLKIVMYGSISDYNFIKRIRTSDIKSLKATIPKSNRGVGLHIKEEGKKFGNPELQDYYFINPPDKLQRYYTNPKIFKKLGSEHSKYRELNKYFEAPIILIKEGLTDQKVVASFEDINCIYKKAILGIKVNENKNFQKALVSFFNSKFAMYYLFLTNSSFGIDRQRIQGNHLLELPSLPYHFSDETIIAIAEEYDSISLKMKETNANNLLKSINDRKIHEIENHIDDLIFDEITRLNLINEDDKVLINDLINYSLDWYLNKNNDKINYAIKSVTVDELKSYSEMLLNQLPNKLQTNIRVEYYDTIQSIPLKIVAIKLNQSENAITKIVDTEFNKLLIRINKYVIKEYSESIFFRREFEYFENNTILLIKPNEKKFWSKSIAISDSEKIFVQFASIQG